MVPGDIGNKEKMQQEDIDLKNCLFMCSRRSWREGNFGRVSAKVYGMPKSPKIWWWAARTERTTHGKVLELILAVKMENRHNVRV